MPFETACTYQPTGQGFVFLPEDAESDYQCDLRVTFQPLSYYPPEPDIGAGYDFDAEIASIEVADHSGRQSWRTLEGAERESAELLLNAFHRDAMWAAAEAETVEAFAYGRAA